MERLPRTLPAPGAPGAAKSVEEQIELVEALWDNIVERNAVPAPTEAQRAELDRRLSEHAAHPDDVDPWSEVKYSALPRIRG